MIVYSKALECICEMVQESGYFPNVQNGHVHANFALLYLILYVYVFEADALPSSYVRKFDMWSQLEPWERILQNVRRARARTDLNKYYLAK